MQLKRPIVWMALPSAVISALGSAFHISFIFILIILIIFFLFLYFSKILQKKQIIFLFIFSLLSLIIISASGQKPEIIRQLESSEKGINAHIQGRIKKITVTDNDMKIILKKCILLQDGNNIQLDGMVLSCPADERFKTGSVIEAEGVLKPMDKARNYGNFDEREYYGALKIFSKMKTEHVEFIRGPDNIVSLSAAFFSENMKKSFETISPEYEGSISSIILGDQGRLDPSLKELYKENGISHLLAISGLHVSFAGSVIYKILRRRGFSFFSSAFCAGFCVITYTVMTGSAISAIRASVMFLFAVFADVTGRSYDAPSALSAQMAATLFIYPEAIVSASFLMSYMSVASIIFSEKLFNEISVIPQKNPYEKKVSAFIKRLILSDLKISFSVFAGLLPINLYFYYETPVYSVILNMLIIPVAGILMGSCFAAGITGALFAPAGVFLIGVAERIFDLYAFLCRWFSSLPYSTLITGKPEKTWIIIYYGLIFAAFFLFYFFRKKGMPVRSLMSLPIVLLAFFLITKRPEKDFFMSMIDVGQGDCILIHTQSGKNLLFDGGSSDVKNAYKYRVESFLKSKGIGVIDACFISHTDEDHINVITDMLDDCSPVGVPGGIHIKKLILPDLKKELRDEGYIALENKAVTKGISVSYCTSGYEMADERFSVKCINPDPENNMINNGTDLNALSSVFYYDEGKITILLTGDITEDTEAYLLDKGYIKKTDILKVAHHGSKNSSTTGFIKASDPGVAVISCGVNNRYSHPSDETMSRFKESGVNTFVTSRSGGITISKKKDKILVECFLKSK